MTITGQHPVCFLSAQKHLQSESFTALKIEFVEKDGQRVCCEIYRTKHMTHPENKYDHGRDLIWNHFSDNLAPSLMHIWKWNWNEKDVAERGQTYFTPFKLQPSQPVCHRRWRSSHFRKCLHHIYTLFSTWALAISSLTLSLSVGGQGVNIFSTSLHL